MATSATATDATTAPAAPSTLGERVRAARRERGMSQAQLAGEELTKGFISQLESGLVRPSIRSLQVIATRLGRSLDYFVADQPLTAAKRVTFHRLAAEAAAERGDWATVRSQVETALTQTPEARERGALLRVLATAELAAGDREVAFERISEALGILDPATDAAEVAQLLYVRGTAYGKMGQLGAATEALEAARDTIDKHEVSDPRLRARILVGLGTAYRRLNRTAKALSVYENALALASRTSELEVAAQGYVGVAVSLYDAGELDGAISNYQRALSLFERISDTSFELGVLQSLAAVHFEHGQVDEARELAERCLARASAVHERRYGAVAQIELARIALKEGRPADALEVVQAAERTLAELGDEQQRAYALRIAGAVCAELADQPGSDRSYRKAIGILTSIGHTPDLAATAHEYAQRLRARGDIEQAFHYMDIARGPLQQS